MRLADTTAIFEYHVGALGPRTETRSLLADRRYVVTSEHVEREWKRIIVRSVDSLLTALREEPDLPAVFSRLSQGFGREPSQRLRALALCCGSDWDLTEIEIRARQLIRVEMDRLVDQIVSEIRRPSDCPLATNEPFLGKNGSWDLISTCRRNETSCTRVARLDGDLQRWSDGASALVASSRDDYKRQGKAGQKMAADPEYRTGKLCYESTGDLGIALDGRPGEEVITTDRSFEVIGPPLGLTVRVVSTSRPPGESR